MPARCSSRLRLLRHALRLRAAPTASSAPSVSVRLCSLVVRSAPCASAVSNWSRPVAMGVRAFRSSALLAAQDGGDDHEGKGEEENEEEEDDDDDDEDVEDEDLEGAHAAETENAAATQYLGVVYNATKIKKYSAELEMDGHVISGGDYWTALDAARGYDELVDLYCDLDTPRNFGGASSGEEDEDEDADALLGDLETTSAWETPDVGKRHADIIPPIPQTYLTLEEVTAALEREKAIDVYTVDLAGKSSLADYMLFTTGRSQAHMRRMADLLIRSMKARRLDDDFEYAVEGRDCDDWMIADCNNVVVHFMREDTRRILNLEDHWENMVDDKHRVYGDMTEDEYMDKFGTSELMEYLQDDDLALSAEDEDAAAAETDKRAKRRLRRQAGAQGDATTESADDLDWK